MKKINKWVAKKMFENGETFVMVPSKINPYGLYGVAEIRSEHLKEYTTFESLYNNFRYHNCNYETGYYPAFYVMED